MIINIRPEKTEDQKVLYDLIQQAFGQEDESKLVDLLRRDDSFIPELSLVAVYEGQPVGFILFTKISIVDEKGVKHPSLALAPMAVLPGYQRKGIGSQLVRKGLKRAKALGHSSVIVLGHKDYYPKFGFVPAERWNINTHYEVPAEYFMALELNTDALSGISGMVQYARPFEMV